MAESWHETDETVSILALALDRFDGYRSAHGEKPRTACWPEWRTRCAARRHHRHCRGSLSQRHDHSGRAGVRRQRGAPARRGAAARRSRSCACRIPKSVAADHVTASVAAVTGQVKRGVDRVHLLTQAISEVQDAAGAGGNRSWRSGLSAGRWGSCVESKRVGVALQWVCACCRRPWLSPAPGHCRPHRTSGVDRDREYRDRGFRYVTALCIRPRATTSSSCRACSNMASPIVHRHRRPGLQHVDIAAPTYASAPVSATRNSAAATAVLQGQFMGSPPARRRCGFPGTNETSNPAAIGYTDVETDLRGLFGQTSRSTACRLSSTWRSRSVSAPARRPTSFVATPPSACRRRRMDAPGAELQRGV